MTTRERNLWLIVAAVGLVSLGSYLVKTGPNWFKGRTNGVQPLKVHEAYRLLRSQKNIMAHSQLVELRLAELKAQMIEAASPEEAQILLLYRVESLAAASNLSIQNKNTLKLSDQEVGVALEGKSSVESVISFVQKSSAAAIGLKVKRLQLHGIPEKRLLSYQIVLSAWQGQQEGARP